MEHHPPAVGDRPDRRKSTASRKAEPARSRAAGRLLAACSVNVENLLHHVRDRTFREDDSKTIAGRLPRVTAGLRNLAISVHRQDGRTNIAAALRQAARGWDRPLTALGLTE
ncbi:hypothetical protein LUR56_06735 [Streptomyces sp. MT29]|nr:hypothetical protein [Streptomyces sp. MT29]